MTDEALEVLVIPVPNGCRGRLVGLRVWNEETGDSKLFGVQLEPEASTLSIPVHGAGWHAAIERTLEAEA